MIKILFLALISIFFLGCVPTQKQENTPKQKTLKEPPFHYMYVKTDTKKFKKGDKVKVYAIVNGLAKTSKGNIKASKLEKQRSEFQLYVASPNATRIRILNIKPKYKDGIWLKAGNYHIELSAKKYITYKKWISIKQDTNLSIALKHKKNISRGFIHWTQFKDTKYINGVFWQDEAINKQTKMHWEQADAYCKSLKITINKHISIDDFTLPSEEELISLRKHNAKLDYTGTIYWSALSDTQHPQFAKYIYINRDKSGWYNKSGKTYVRCISRKHYPLHLPVQKLAQYLMKHEKYSYLNAYEFAVDLKYGKPVIKNVVKIKNHKVKLTLRSQKYDAKKNYFYYKNYMLKEKKDIAHNPDVKFEIINNKLVFRAIN